MNRKIHYILVTLVLPLMASTCLQGMKHPEPEELKKLYMEGFTKNQPDKIRKALEGGLDPNTSQLVQPPGQPAAHVLLLSVALEKMTRYPSFRAVAEQFIASPTIRLATLQTAQHYLQSLLGRSLTVPVRSSLNEMMVLLQDKIKALKGPEEAPLSEEDILLKSAFAENDHDSIVKALKQGANPNLSELYAESRGTQPTKLSLLEIAINKMTRHFPFIKVISAFIASPHIQSSILEDALVYAITLRQRIEKNKPSPDNPKAIQNYKYMIALIKSAIDSLSEKIGDEGQKFVLQKAINLRSQNPNVEVPLAMEIAFRLAKKGKNKNYLDLVIELARTPGLSLSLAIDLLSEYREKIAQEQLAWAGTFIKKSLKVALELAITAYSGLGEAESVVAEERLPALLKNPATEPLIMSVFEYALARGYIRSVLYLLEHKLSDIKSHINETDLQNGMTALAYAAGTGNLELVQKILALGADPNIFDHNGYTALDHAIRPRAALYSSRGVEESEAQKAIVRLLKEHGGKTALELGVKPYIPPPAKGI
jgi:hypothetical protein